MALAFRSATEAGTNSAATSLAINVPSGVQDGDHLVLFGVTADGDDGGFDALTGWTEEVDAATFNTGGSAPSPPGMSVWRRIASSEPASYTITPSFGSTGIAAKMIAISGGDDTTQWDVAETTATGDGTNADPPSITPVTDGAITVVAAFWDSTGTVWSAAPTGYTDSGGLGSVAGVGGGNGCTCAMAHRNSTIDPATAENPAAFSSSTEQWGAVTVALRPAAEGITSVTPDEFDMNTADVDVASTADVFDASANDVYLSDADTLAGSVNEVDISSAINTEAIGLINLDLTQLSAGELASLHTLGPGARYVIVDATGGEYSWPVTLHRPIAFVMSLSAEFAPGSTTSRLTGLTGTFAGGRIEEAVNPSATTTNVATDGNREDVWNIQATTESREVAYVARVLYGGNVPDTITQTPTITISAGTSLTVDSGSYSWTGQTASLEYHSLVEANAGSYVWTGQTASLEFGALISAEAASYSWSGQDVSFLFSPALIADAASYSWSGQDVSLELGALVAADAGSYAWSGQDASLEFGAALIAESASYAWTGTDVSLELGALVDAEAGSWTWTGTDASLEFSAALNAESASYSWTGQEVTFPTGLNIVADSASFSWTGQDAALELSSLLSAETASYAWSGQDASLEFGTIISAESGSYAWAGTDAGLAATRILHPADSGAFIWTGSSANLLADNVITAESVAYVWTGADADLIYAAGLTLIAEAGSYNWSGQPVTLDYTSGVQHLHGRRRRGRVIREEIPVEAKKPDGIKKPVELKKPEPLRPEAPQVDIFAGFKPISPRITFKRPKNVPAVEVPEPEISEPEVDEVRQKALLQEDDMEALTAISLILDELD